MADIVSRAKRSEMMAGIRGKDTQPELVVRKELFRRGFRYRLHVAGLPGKPDLVLPKYSAVIFVHGCFWHCHQCSTFKWPKTNKAFWKHKLGQNKLRDAEDLLRLEKLGWRVVVIWECSIRRAKTSNIQNIIQRVAEWLSSGRKTMHIE